MTFVLIGGTVAAGFLTLVFGLLSLADEPYDPEIL